jgi:hypothetical protein
MTVETVFVLKMTVLFHLEVMVFATLVVQLLAVFMTKVIAAMPNSVHSGCVTIKDVTRNATIKRAGSMVASAWLKIHLPLKLERPRLFTHLIKSLVSMTLFGYRTLKFTFRIQIFNLNFEASMF